MNNRSLLLLVTTALHVPEVGNDFRRLALGDGVTEQQWEDLAATLYHEPEIPVLTAEMFTAPIVDIGNAPESHIHTSSNTSYYEWLPVEPRNADVQWEDGDYVWWRTSRIGKREYSVSPTNQPPMGSVFLRRIQKGDPR